MNIMSFIKKWPSGDCRKWAVLITDERRGSFESREYIHKEKPYTCTQRSSYMLFSLCICHLYSTYSPRSLLSGFNNHDFKRLYKIY